MDSEQAGDNGEAVPAAEDLARGVGRLLAQSGYVSIPEFTLRNGRRADIAGLDRRGDIFIVEIKRSLADFAADRKWPDYLDYCDRFAFAVPRDFPLEVLPADQGLLIADAFAASYLRPPAPSPNPPKAARRREVHVRFARTAAKRLWRLTDPLAGPPDSL